MKRTKVNKKNKHHAMCALLILLCLCAPRTALARAWLMPAGETKMIIKNNHHRHDYSIIAERVIGNPAPPVNIMISTREKQRDIFIEHGISATRTLSFKYNNVQTTRNSNARTHEQEIYEIGLRLPVKLKLGLLPFGKALAKRIFKSAEIHQTRPAAVNFYVLHHGSNQRPGAFGYGINFSHGDKISINRWALLQEAQYDYIKFPNAQWRRALHRIQIGYDEKIWLGQETRYFQDRVSLYRSIARETFLETTWRLPRAKPLTIRLGRGVLRTSETPRFGRYMRLEMEFLF